MNHLGLFAGIGGFELAARWMGWETIAWCEWNEFGQKVLRHHFPEAIGHGDITKTDFTPYANRIDILTGGFPCQPYSTAGKRLGKEDDRHLWPEMLRAIREISPRSVVGENVRGLTNWNGGMVFDEVQADLEAEGYEVLPFLLPACAVNAPHRRDRIWFVAYSHGAGLQAQGPKQQTAGVEQCGKLDSTQFSDTVIRNASNTGGSGLETNNALRKPEGAQHITRDISEMDATNANSFMLQGSENIRNIKNIRERRNEQFTGLLPSNWEIFPTQSPICSRNDGLPGGLDGITFSKWRQESIKAYGNAIVPQVAYEIFKAIQQYESL